MSQLSSLDTWKKQQISFVLDPTGPKTNFKVTSIKNTTFDLATRKQNHILLFLCLAGNVKNLVEPSDRQNKSKFAKLQKKSQHKFFAGANLTLANRVLFSS